MPPRPDHRIPSSMLPPLSPFPLADLRPKCSDHPFPRAEQAALCRLPSTTRGNPSPPSPQEPHSEQQTGRRGGHPKCQVNTGRILVRILHELCVQSQPPVATPGPVLGQLFSRGRPPRRPLDKDPPRGEWGSSRPTESSCLLTRGHPSPREEGQGHMPQREAGRHPTQGLHVRWARVLAAGYQVLQSPHMYDLPFPHMYKGSCCPLRATEV